MADVKYAGEMGVMSGSRSNQCLCSSLTTEYHTFHMQLVAFPPCQQPIVKDKCLKTGDFSYETINLCLWYCLISVVGMDLTSPCENYDFFQPKTRMQRMKKNFLFVFRQMSQLCIILLPMLRRRQTEGLLSLNYNYLPGEVMVYVLTKAVEPLLPLQLILSWRMQMSSL